MKKLLLISLAVLMFAFASIASAQVISNPSTNARMDGLGVPNWMIEDDFNVWINPAQVNNYKNVLYGELGTDPCSDPAVGACGSTNSDTGVNERNEDAWGGFNTDSAVGTWGFYLGRPFDAEISALIDGVGGAADVAPEANRFDLFYGLPGAPIGLYLGYANESEDISDPAGDADYESNAYYIGVGGAFMDGMLEAALNVGLADSDINDPAGGALTSVCAADPCDGEEDVTTYSILVRHHAAAPGGTWLSTLQYNRRDADEADETTDAIRLDTALNSRPADNALVVFGVGIAYSKTENDTLDTKETNLAIPVNLALEHHTFKKVMTRLGIAKAIYDSTKDETATTETETVADGDATVSVGLGVMFTDKLTMDAVINQDVLFTGTYLVSGISETLSAKLSATYRF